MLTLIPFTALVPSSASGQQAAKHASAAAISGRIIDATTGAPLPQAIVYLKKGEAAAPAGQDSGEGHAIRASRTAFADSLGTYSFQRLAPGSYTVLAKRPGYAPSSVSVDLVGNSAVNVSLGLEFQPVPLPRMTIVGYPTQSFPRTLSTAAEIAGARKVVALQRQENYLATDVRTLTAGDVLDAVTLAESDIFRALQRVPGVGRRDDYTAVLWTRGAPWVQTRVYFDGLPLYNPTHGGWLFSSINPDGVGSAYFEPGVHSAEWGEGAAAVLDLRSRAGTGPEPVTGRAEFSLASARLTADGQLPGGATWMLAGRRTYVDLLTSAWDAVGAADNSYVPYDFSDFIGRFDLPLFAGLKLEASGIGELDRLRGDIPDLTAGNEASWGNRAGRVTLDAPLGPIRVRGTLGATHFSTDVDQEEIPIPAVGTSDIPTLPTMTSTIEHRQQSIRVESAPSLPGPQWAFGFEMLADSVRYDGPLLYTGEGVPGLPRKSPLEFSDRLDYRAIWGEVRLGILDRFEIEGGLRYEVGDSVRNAGRQRVAPRVSARWTAPSGLLVSAGWGRSYQYTQAIGASAGPLGPQLHLSNVWVVAGRGYPVMDSEVATVGAEKWIDDDWLVSANLYQRRVSGITDPDPTPGPIRPDAQHVEATNVARGIELSARRLAGRWTLDVGYALGESVMHVDSLTYPGSADIRHTLDITTAYRLDDGWRFGAAFSAASGVPYTRIIVGDEPILGDPHAERTPIYASLDLMLDYSTEYRGWEVGAYLQLLNALGRENAVTYGGSEEFCAGGPSGPGDGACASPIIHDDFTAGLPRLPLFGFNIAF